LNSGLVANEGLENLANLKDLESLTLRSWNGSDHALILSDGGLKGLARLESLRTLSLYLDCQEDTAAGIRRLAGLRHLKSLNIVCSAAHDEFLASLAALMDIEELTLHLPNSVATDAGLKKLAVLQNLSQLGIETRSASPKTADELRRALPNCKVNWSKTSH
jgi:hypothetical protein